MSDIYTIGHSQHPLPAFVELLAQHAVTLLVDVRAAPYSRRHPQFHRAALAAGLEAQDIRYRWLGQALGGLRAPVSKSPHTALTEPAFQAYAAHLGDEDFRDTLAKLVVAAARHRVAVMCAEADHTHCHRQFIADVLTVQGHAVLHITASGALRQHRLHAGLRVVDGQLLYDRHGQGDLFQRPGDCCEVATLDP